MRVVRPGDLEEALAAMAEPDSGEAPVPIAGGTDLLVHWPERLEMRERTFVDLWGLDELAPVTWDDDALTLGARTTYWDVVSDPEIGAEFPLLVDAARLVGAIQIQSRGTWAGNIVNASPAADGVPVLMAYDAEVDLASTEGRRTVPLDRFYSGYKEMDRRPDELVVAIRLPRRERGFQRFVKVGSRRAQAIAKVGLAVAETGAGWRVVAASVAPTIRRCRAVEEALDAGRRPDAPEGWLPLLAGEVAPIDDLRSSAAYRERALANVLHWAVAESDG